MEIESIDQVGDKYAVTFVDENVNPILTIYITEKERQMIAEAYHKEKVCTVLSDEKIEEYAFKESQSYMRPLKLAVRNIIIEFWKWAKNELLK